MLAIRVIGSAVLISLLSGCVSDLNVYERDPYWPQVWRDARPRVDVQYPDNDWSRLVHKNTSYTIETEGDCVTYFTVTAPYLSDDSDPGPDSKKHTVLHYVIGGYGPDDTDRGRVRINSVEMDYLGKTKFNPGEGVALIDVEQGWVWVSDSPPGNWNGLASALAPNDDGEEPQASGQPGDTPGPMVVDVWGGWSIITLLKGEWTWSGALGTEFIHRVRPYIADKAGERFQKVYSISGMQAQHSVKQSGGSGALNTTTLENGYFTSATDGSKEPGTPELISNYQEEIDFVEYVNQQVESVTQGAGADCKDSKAAASQ